MIIIIIYALSGIVAFLLFCRASLNSWGSVSRGDVILFTALSMAGPVSVFVALMVTLIAAMNNAAFWSKQVWPRAPKGGAA